MIDEFVVEFVVDGVGIRVYAKGRHLLGMFSNLICYGSKRTRTPTK